MGVTFGQGGALGGDDQNLDKLRYATEWQIEIGKILQSFDPVLRPMEDMAKHGITMAIVLLGLSASIVGGFASGTFGVSWTHLLVLGAWLGFVVAAAAGTVQLHRIARFREAILSSCHALLGKERSLDDRKKAIDAMQAPKKQALTVQYWAIGISTALLVFWALLRTIT